MRDGVGNMDNIAGIENELQKYNKKRIITLIIECLSVVFMLFNLTFSFVGIIAFVFYLFYNSKVKKIKRELSLLNADSNISSSNQVNTNTVIENVKNDKKESSETLYIKSFENIKDYDLDELKSHEALSDCKVCAYIYLEMINADGVCYTAY